MPPAPAIGSGHFHAVRFYRDADSLCAIVTNFIGEGLARAQPAVVIATPAHRVGIEERLRTLRVDVDGLQRQGDLFLLDAEAMLSTFMVDGMPHAARFTAAIVPVLEQACRGRQECTIYAYGEMVDVLWKAGQTSAATRLEMLWNALAQSHSFSLLCGYSMGNFYKDAAVEDICSHHSHVLSGAGEAVAVN
jgi:hypothetical protein